MCPFSQRQSGVCVCVQTENSIWRKKRRKGTGEQRVSATACSRGFSLTDKQLGFPDISYMPFVPNSQRRRNAIDRLVHVASASSVSEPEKTVFKYSEHVQFQNLYSSRIHTADADATKLDSFVACELGISNFRKTFYAALTKLHMEFHHSPVFSIPHYSISQ